MFKRGFDLMLSSLMLVILSPFFAIIFLLIKLDTKGPALFRQKRVGKHGKEFIIYKFRTMHYDTPHIPTNSLKNRDKHITRVGKILRTTSLDELPQLLNILKGEMSFVGPRPVIPAEEELIRKRKKSGVYRLKPGVTGWAQINGRDHVTIDEKVELDTYYLNNQSFWLDIKIILITAIKVFKRDGILEHNKERHQTISIEKQKEEVAVSAEESYNYK